MRLRNLRFAGLLAVGAISAAVSLTACGDIAKRIESKVVAVNLLLDTGNPFGISTGGVGSVTGVTVNLAEITGPINAPTATPVTNAAVTMKVGTSGSVVVTLNASSSGSYAAVSGSSGAPTFAYASNQTYSITMIVPESDPHAGTYTTSIKAPPKTQVTGIPDALTPIPHGQPLTVTVVGTYSYGIVVVVDSSGSVTYTNKPTTPQEAVDFILNDFHGTMTIPGTAFPNAGSAYGIAVAGMASAPPSGISSNLNILTHYLAGSAKTAIVTTN